MSHTNLITHRFGGAVSAHRHTNSTPKVKQVVQTAANGGAERCWQCSWSRTKTSSYLWVTKQHVTLLTSFPAQHFQKIKKCLPQEFLQGLHQAAIGEK